MPGHRGGRPAGVEKTPGSGKKKGSVNKKTLLFRELVDSLAEQEFSPVEKLIAVFDKAIESFDSGRGRGNVDLSHNYLDIARKCAADLMPYLYPKKKSVDVSLAKDSGRTLVDLVMSLSKNEPARQASIAEVSSEPTSIPR